MGLSIFSIAQIKVDQNGNVGIKTLTPAYGLDIKTGAIRFDNWRDFYIDMNDGLEGCPVIYPERDWWLQLGMDDYRIGNGFFDGIHSYHFWEDGASEESKEGFEPIVNVLSKLKEVNGVKYHLPDSLLTGLPGYIQQQYAKERFGFVIDQIEAVFPQVVFNDDSTGSKYLSYTRFIPVLVEAIKQQQKEIEFLYSINGGASFKSSTGETPKNQSGTNENLKTNCKLFQNSPNPFSKSTSIKYDLSSEVIDAAIYIFNLQGTLLKTYDIAGTGNGSVTINEGELKPGMYFYTLVANGTEVDTKKMILTD